MADIVFGVSSCVTGIAGLVCAVVVATRNKKKDDVSDGQNIGTLHADIGYIKKGIDGIENRLKDLESRYIDVVTQLTEVTGEVNRHKKRLEKLESFHVPKQ